MKPTSYSLLDRVPAKLDAELVEELLRTPGLRIERIVSNGTFDR